MRIQLIQPSIGSYAINSRTGAYAPVGLLSIATYILRECSDIVVEILDGELISNKDIISRLDADIVGINANTVTYPQAIGIARAAKKLGSKIVLGGVYASSLPDIILKINNNIIDTLVVGYGEKPMLEIVKGRAEKLIINKTPQFDILPHPDRSLVNLEEYVQIFRERHPTWNHRATNIFTNVGCTWRALSRGGCIFCSRSGTIATKKHPNIIWREIRELVEDYKIDYLVDFSDSILWDLDWLRAVIEAKPGNLNPAWHVFARIDEINRETLVLLKKLPCVHVFVGIESGDPNEFRASNKGGGSSEQSLAMARLLKKYNIGLTPSYVTGLPGETISSLHLTFEHACQLKEITNFEEIFCSELIPFPGSRAFDLLKGRICLDTDLFDIEDLKYWWAKYFTEIPIRILKDYTHKLLSLGKYQITIDKKCSKSSIKADPIVLNQAPVSS